MNTKRIVRLAALCLIYYSCSLTLTLWAMTRRSDLSTDSEPAPPRASPQDSTATRHQQKSTALPRRRRHVPTHISIAPTPTPSRMKQQTASSQRSPEDSWSCPQQRSKSCMRRFLLQLSASVEVEEFANHSFGPARLGTDFARNGRDRHKCSHFIGPFDKSGNLLANAIVRVKVKDIDRPLRPL